MNVPAGPLAGIRLLDLGTRVAAPFAATLLADLGAEVLKVELPGQCDFLRSSGPFVDGYSLFWAVENRGKKSITCDLRKAAGQALLRRLVPLVDVIVETFQPGTLESWGLGYETLAAVNPALVLTRVSVYGQTGPYRDRPGLDRNGIAAGGLLYVTGYPDRPPVRPGVVIADYLTGVFNALAIVSALWERDRRARETGAPARGQWVDLSLYEAALRVLEWTLAAYDRLGLVREREGNRLANSAPLDNYPTRDGKFVCILAGSDANFSRLCKAMERLDLLDDPRFTKLADRAAHGDLINGIVGEWTATLDAREIESLCIDCDVPVATAYTAADIFADPHMTARGDIVTVDDPVVGPLRQQAPFPRRVGEPVEVPGGAPRLGENTREVLHELLGLSEADLDRFAEQGVI